MCENLMEEAVAPENFRKAIEAVTRNDGAPGITPDAGSGSGETPEDSWGENPGEVAGRDLRSNTWPRGGNGWLGLSSDKLPVAQPCEASGWKYRSQAGA